jgi:hypothetical protein
MTAIEKNLQLQEAVEETGCFLLLAIEGGGAAAPALHGALVNLAKRDPIFAGALPLICAPTLHHTERWRARNSLGAATYRLGVVASKCRRVGARQPHQPCHFLGVGGGAPRQFFV